MLVTWYCIKFNPFIWGIHPQLHPSKIWMQEKNCKPSTLKTFILWLSIDMYSIYRCWATSVMCACLFSFQAAGFSRICPASSLRRGRPDPSPGVWFHAVREHLPRAAAQKGATSISQKILLLVPRWKAYESKSLCTVRAAALMYSDWVPCWLKQTTLRASCSCRLLCSSTSITWHRSASPCPLSAITACSSATTVTLCQSTCPEASWSRCPQTTPCSFTSQRSVCTVCKHSTRRTLKLRTV